MGGLEPGVEPGEGLGVEAGVFERHVDPDGLGGATEAGDLLGDRHGELGNGGPLGQGIGTADGKRRARGGRTGTSFHSVAGGGGELGSHDGHAGSR